MVVAVPVNIRIEIYHWNVHFPIEPWISWISAEKSCTQLVFLFFFFFKKTNSKTVRHFLLCFVSCSVPLGWVMVCCWDGLPKCTGMCCQAHPILSACNSIHDAFWCIDTGKWSGLKLGFGEQTSCRDLLLQPATHWNVCGNTLLFFFLWWISVGFKVPLLAPTKHLELEKLRQLLWKWYSQLKSWSWDSKAGG